MTNNTLTIQTTSTRRILGIPMGKRTRTTEVPMQDVTGSAYRGPFDAAAAMLAQAQEPYVGFGFSN
jgi:hypothetical protein